MELQPVILQNHVSDEKHNFVSDEKQGFCKMMNKDSAEFLFLIRNNISTYEYCKYLGTYSYVLRYLLMRHVCPKGDFFPE